MRAICHIIAEKILFLYTRKIPQRLRNRLLFCYPMVLDLKHMVIYGRRNMFESVILETHNACNRKCSYCPNSELTLPYHRLGMDLILKVLGELKELRFRGNIIFSGFSEPFMDQRLEQIIGRIKEFLPSARLVLYTNGDFLTLERVRRILEQNVILNITIHDQRLSEKLRTTLTSLHFHERARMNIRQGLKSSILSTRGGLVEVGARDRKNFCILPGTEVTITASGDVTLCSDDYFGAVSFGSLYDDSLMSIWNRPDYEKIRRDLKHGLTELSICRNCLGTD